MNANGTVPPSEGANACAERTFDAHLAEVGGDVRRVLEGARRVLYVEAQRLHLLAVDGYFRAAFYICLLGVGLTASISASLFVVRGVRSALLAWSGAEWVGELGAGFVVLGVVVLGGLAVRAQLLRDISRRTKLHLARKPEMPVASHSPGAEGLAS